MPMMEARHRAGTTQYVRARESDVPVFEPQDDAPEETRPTDRNPTAQAEVGSNQD